MVVVQAWQQQTAISVNDVIISARSDRRIHCGDDLALNPQVHRLRSVEQLCIGDQGADDVTSR